MERTTCLEDYPISTVVLSNFHSISIWIIGAYILSGFGLALAIPYVAYCLAIETSVLRNSCRNCYYYGKVCFSGRGRLCALLFKKGDPKKFIDKEISWADILPDLLVSIFPIVGGIVLLTISFSWLTVALIAILLFLSFGGNAIIRGNLACKYCKQREIGCPAQKLFERKTGSSG